MPPMSIKNRMINTLLWLAKRSQRSVNFGSKRRFLIVSTTGLGDSLWGTAALRSLRQSFPEAYIGLLTSPIGKEVFQNNPYLDEIFKMEDRAFFSLVSLFFALKKRRVETILLFHASQRIILPFCSLLGPKMFLGTAEINKGLDHLLTEALPNKMSHEILRRLQIVEKAGAKHLSPSLEIYLSESDQKEADDFLARHQIPDYVPIVGMHPGAKDRFKQWDPACFIELGSRLVNHLGCQVIVTGNASEKDLILQIARKIPGAIPVVGDLPLRGLAALIQKMRLMVCNDTGPMHIAFAMRTPTVALFSPTDPERCGPVGDVPAIVVAKPRTCTPCLKKRCRSPFCLLQIGPDEVYEAALRLFYHN